MEFTAQEFRIDKRDVSNNSKQTSRDPPIIAITKEQYLSRLGSMLTVMTMYLFSLMGRDDDNNDDDDNDEEEEVGNGGSWL